MPARRGAQVLQRLREYPHEIWHQGERVPDVTTHPAFTHGVHSLAALYDMQWGHPEEMLYDSPTTGEKVGLSFLMPRTHDDLVRVRTMMGHWANYSLGMMGRTPDYLNRAMMAYAAGAEFLAQADPRFGDHARTYYAYLREHDLTLTHTLINPQVNRAVGPAQQVDPFLAARVKEETDAGIVIRGARMLATLPAADELMVFPSTLLRSTEDDAPYAFAFAISSATPGLRYICRETVDYGRSPYDHPLGARFEELDAVVVFDDVFIPWERVFLYRDITRCNQAYTATGAVVHITHQVVTRTIAKTEFLLGLASLLIDTIGVEQFQHIHEKVTEIWVALETLKAFMRTAEADAQLDQFGVMRPAWDPLDAARHFYPKTYPRLIEIIQLIGASGLVAVPTAADLHGPLTEDITHYYQAARATAAERIPLFRLAWDTALSAFGTRQVLYERFFFGDPVRMAGVVFQTKDRTALMERVRHFLAQSQQEL